MPENKEKKNSNAGDQSLAAKLFEYVEMFVFAAIFVVLLMTLGLRLCVVSGTSMNNTLLNGERLVISNLFYTPKQGDVIVFHQTSDTDEQFNEPIVKRVIATSGQFVKVDDIQHKVYVSDDDVFTEDEVLPEPYIIVGAPHYAAIEGISPIEVYQVPEGHLFVMGDNRPVSADSRYHEVSFVDQRRVLGKVLFRLMPFTVFA